MDIKIIDTPEKFQSLAEEIVPPLLELVTPRCTEKMLKWGTARSFGKPTKYEYLDTEPDCQVVFTMKSAKKATVETRRGPGVKEQHRFTLRPTDGGWMIGSVDYRLAVGDSWSVEHSV